VLAAVTKRALAASLLAALGLGLFVACGGSGGSQKTLSARQVASALRKHGVRARITWRASEIRGATEMNGFLGLSGVRLREHWGAIAFVQASFNPLNAPASAVGPPYVDVVVADRRQRPQETRPLDERFVQDAHRNGFQGHETVGLADLGRLDLLERDYESARNAYTTALARLRLRGDKYYELEALRGLGLASLGLDRRSEARSAFAEMLDLALAQTQTHSRYIAQALSGIALASDPADSDRAAQLRGAIAQLNEDADIATNAYSGAADQLERHFEQTLVLALGAAAWSNSRRPARR
jgi:hypothetical protein